MLRVAKVDLNAECNTKCEYSDILRLRIKQFCRSQHLCEQSMSSINIVQIPSVKIQQYKAVCPAVKRNFTLVAESRYFLLLPTCKEVYYITGNSPLIYHSHISNSLTSHIFRKIWIGQYYNQWEIRRVRVRVHYKFFFLKTTIRKNLVLGYANDILLSK